MKKILNLLILTSLLLSSCKKDDRYAQSSFPASDPYLSNIRQFLRQHGSNDDYNNADFTHYRLSKQQDFWYTRVALRNKTMATDFILVKMDSNGHTLDGRIIHLARNVRRSVESDGQKNIQFNNYTGTIDIYSFDKSTALHSAITHGFIEAFHPNIFISNTRETSLPDPYDELPEVIVVGYHNVVNEGSNYSFADFMMLQSFFNSGGGGGGYNSNTGGGNGAPVVYSYGGGYYPNGYGYTNGNNNPSAENNMPADLPDIAISPDYSYQRPQIDMDAWMKCFTGIPDQGATCSVTLLGDLPVDTDPGIGLNIWSGNTGHCFLQLTKTNGGQSVTQIIGFTAENPFQAIVNTEAFVAGKTVDNAGHKYNCSITMNVAAEDFNTIINKMKSLSASMPYSVVNYDCLDYGLEVFNSARPGNPLVIPKFYSMSDPFSNIATGPKLYTLLQQMIEMGSPESANIMAGGPMYAGVSHGPCQ